MTDEWQTARLVSADNKLGFTVRYKLSDYYADFMLYECIGFEPDDRPCYSKRGCVATAPTADLDEAEVCMAGSIKWDGCSNVEYPETRECMQHLCGRGGWRDWCSALMALYDEVAPKIPAYDKKVGDA